MAKYQSIRERMDEVKAERSAALDTAEGETLSNEDLSDIYI